MSDVSWISKDPRIQCVEEFQINNWVIDVLFKPGVTPQQILDFATLMDEAHRQLGGSGMKLETFN